MLVYSSTFKANRCFNLYWDNFFSRTYFNFINFHVSEDFFFYQEMFSILLKSTNQKYYFIQSLARVEEKHGLGVFDKFWNHNKSVSSAPSQSSLQKCQLIRYQEKYYFLPLYHCRLILMVNFCTGLISSIIDYSLID